MKHSDRQLERDRGAAVRRGSGRSPSRRAPPRPPARSRGRAPRRRSPDRRRPARTARTPCRARPPRIPGRNRARRSRSRVAVAIRPHLDDPASVRMPDARCRRGSRPPAGPGRRRHAPARASRRPEGCTPARSARSVELGGDALDDLETSTSARWTGRRPRSDRASTRRSCVSRRSRSVSCAMLRSAASSSSRLRGSFSARSTSALRTPSGVRSSWLASSTNRRSRSSASWTRSSIPFSVSASRWSSSPVSGTGSRRSGSLERDRRRFGPEPLDRAERGTGEDPSERRRARASSDRPADGHEHGEPRDGLSLILDVHAEDEERRRPPAGRRGAARAPRSSTVRTSRSKKRGSARVDREHGRRKQRLRGRSGARSRAFRPGGRTARRPRPPPAIAAIAASGSARDRRRAGPESLVDRAHRAPRGSRSAAPRRRRRGPRATAPRRRASA